MTTTFRRKQRQTVIAEVGDVDPCTITLVDVRLPGGSNDTIAQVKLNLTPPMTVITGETVEVEVRMDYADGWVVTYPLYFLPLRIKKMQSPRTRKGTTATSVLGKPNWRDSMAV